MKSLLPASTLAAATLAAVLAAALPASAAEDPTQGLWVNDNGWVVETAPCDEGMCGTVVAVGGRTDNPRRFDDRNADPALRTRPLCGIRVFGGFESAGAPGEWEGGWVYNPQDGKTYNANMEAGDGGTLDVRGYVLTPMLGRTMTLQRQTTEIDRCSPEEFAADTPPAPAAAAP
jgi:uncharacterized protein (DUF2147 family)